jgi:L-aminopeptidase/D-esterase-like protein
MSSAGSTKPFVRNDDICDVPGILVGHDTQLEAGTGCTVVLCEWPALGSVDVRGGAPATRETDLLSPLSFMQEVHAVLLTGGSAFGLDAATGVMRQLSARGVGYDTGVARVPIVPAAALFDLAIGAPDVRPDADAGARATLAAAAGPLAQGSVGAGTGASIGKLGGPALSTKGGIGSASVTLPDGHILGALVAANALGDVYDESSGRILAGARAPLGGGWLVNEPDGLRAEERSAQMSAQTALGGEGPGSNTTLAVVATNAPFSKTELAKLAQMAHDGLASSIRPAHTPLDGDIIFALSTARPEDVDPHIARGGLGMLSLVMGGALAARTLARAVNKAVRLATTLHGVPALQDLPFAEDRQP